MTLKEYGGFPGVRLSTASYPQGVQVRARIAPVLADSPARVEITGFMGHAGNLFCAFCSETDVEAVELDPLNEREDSIVRSQAMKWRASETVTGREQIEAQFGVKWSALYELDYWRPQKHVVLGYMHNWNEGILKDHLRTLWGIGRDGGHTESANQRLADEQFDDADMEESGSELGDLAKEQEEWDKIQAKIRQSNPPRSQTPSTDGDGDIELNLPKTPPRSSMILDPQTPTPRNPQPGVQSTPRQPQHGRKLRRRIRRVDYSDPYQDSDSDDENHVEVPPGVFTMTSDQLRRIREAIRDVLIPTWVNRPPTNLGDAAHGKLKAEEFYTLFALVFPLIIPELWHGGSPTDRKMLENFHHLVICTNIVCSYQTSSADAALFADRYTEYRRGLHILFPQWPSVPNTHWAMHNPSFLNYWGPLAPLSEFPGERLVGDLQTVNTNRHLRKFFVRIWPNNNKNSRCEKTTWILPC